MVTGLTEASTTVFKALQVGAKKKLNPPLLTVETLHENLVKNRLNKKKYFRWLFSRKNGITPFQFAVYS